MKYFFTMINFLLIVGCAQSTPSQRFGEGNLEDLNITNISPTFASGTLPYKGEVVMAKQLRGHRMMYIGPIKAIAIEVLLQGSITALRLKNKKQKLEEHADEVLKTFDGTLNNIKIAELSDLLTAINAQSEGKFLVHFSPKLVVSQDAKFITLQTSVDITHKQSKETYSNLISVSDEIEVDELSVDSETARQLLKRKFSNLLKTTYDVVVMTMPNVMKKCGSMSQTKYQKSGRSKVILGRSCGTIAEKKIFLTNRNNFLAIPSYLVEI
jgi:hypothetical protein